MGSKKRTIVIKPDEVIPFEVPDEIRKMYYSQDEYKYLIHYFRAFPEGRIPILQYLLLRFHPLIVKTAGHYVNALDMEWRDLITFTRLRFVELVYRFNLRSTLYFRTYIQTALRRAVYDRVLYVSRRRGLTNAISLDAKVNGQEKEIEPLISFPTLGENAKEIARKLIAYVSTTNELTPQERVIFKLRFVKGQSISRICEEMHLASFFVVARQRKIKDILYRYAKKYLI